MNETQARFLSVLKQEASVLQNVHEILLEENNALKERSTDLIDQMTEQKNMMLDQLAVLDKQRQLYIEDETHFYEINDHKTAFSQNINTLNIEIQNSLEKCKQQNKINGGIIEMSHMFNEKILNIIYGNSEKEVTYNPEGKNNSVSNQQSIARV